MSAVFSAADKWEEPWHESLSNNAKVLYDYLYDTADNAGFKPVNKKIWCVYTGLDLDEINVVIDELKELVIIENGVAWIKHHLEYNRNVDILTQNNAKAKIRKIYEANKNHKTAYYYYSTLIDSTLLYSTEPWKKGIQVAKAKDVYESGSPLKPGELLQMREDAKSSED